jgi:hypothetical protein
MHKMKTKLKDEKYLIVEPICHFYSVLQMVNKVLPRIK